MDFERYAVSGANVFFGGLLIASDVLKILRNEEMTQTLPCVDSHSPG